MAGSPHEGRPAAVHERLQGRPVCLDRWLRQVRHFRHFSVPRLSSQTHTSLGQLSLGPSKQALPIKALKCVCSSFLKGRYQILRFMFRLPLRSHDYNRHPEDLLSANLCLVTLLSSEQFPQFEIFCLQHVQLVNKQTNFMKKHVLAIIIMLRRAELPATAFDV